METTLSASEHEQFAEFTDTLIRWLMENGGDLKAWEIVLALMLSLSEILRLVQDFEGEQESLYRLIQSQMPEILAHGLRGSNIPTVH
jgi:hypothetical protein